MGINSQTLQLINMKFWTATSENTKFQLPFKVTFHLKYCNYIYTRVLSLGKNIRIMLLKYSYTVGWSMRDNVTTTLAKTVIY